MSNANYFDIATYFLDQLLRGLLIHAVSFFDINIAAEIRDKIEEITKSQSLNILSFAFKTYVTLFFITMTVSGLKLWGLFLWTKHFSANAPDLESGHNVRMENDELRPF